MKKTVYFFALLITITIQAQVINQDANGFSTIVLKSTNLNFDIANDIATFTYYDYIHKNGKIPGVEQKAIMLGGDIKATAENGSGVLFSDEKLVANAGIGGFIGLKWYRQGCSGSSSRLNQLGVDRDNIENLLEGKLQAYRDYLDQLKSEPRITQLVIDSLRRDIKDPNTNRWTASKNALTAIKELDSKKVKQQVDILQKVDDIYSEINLILLLNGDKSDFKNQIDALDQARSSDILDQSVLKVINSNITNAYDTKLWQINKKTISKKLAKVAFQHEIIEADIVDELLSYYDDEIFMIMNQNEDITTKLENLENKKDRYSFHKLFTRGGFNGVSFKYDLANGASAIDDRFVDKTFNGWDIELGYNINYKGYNLFGLSSKVAYDNNLSGLEDTEYSFATVDTTITTGQLSSGTKVNAFAGDFDTFHKFSFNFDYVRLIPLRDSKKGISDMYLTINPYIRHHIYDNSEILKNNTVTGLGLNFVNSEKQAIMGGLFVQTNDVFGVHANEDSTLGERISVGVVAKFAFSGLDKEANK
ncbi:hypothetical protein [Aquimarina sediminis]|uniref:hypothetical protein n=1 Tax=Aquimarina sediminis TaxID=2070536 RepID=UPI000CA0436F|nr:hypothetical protein [Aquimarina sediminis]